MKLQVHNNHLETNAVCQTKKFGKLMRAEYPLVMHCIYSNNKKEVSFYVNAKYKARKGK